MMSDAIKNFYKQFEFEPEIINGRKLKKYKKFVVCGMGGSQLAIDILKKLDPTLDIISHRDYGLPELIDLKQRLVILSSYSGNTEEVLSSMKLALKKKLPIAAVAVGGKLLAEAKINNIPYVQMPDTGVQPRCALGFSLRGLMKLIGLEKELKETFKLAKILKATDFENTGKELAEKLKGFVPVFYASRENYCLALISKIKFNENGKIPAFFNVFPELNHNEMNGMDVVATNSELSKKFCFIFIIDKDDLQRNKKRIEITKDLYKKRGLKVEFLELKGKNTLEKIFSNLLIIDWASHYTALNYGYDSEPVPLVEEFKGLMKK